MEILRCVGVTTIGALKHNEQGYAHPLYIMHEHTADKYWIHPLCPVYEAPAIGALITRTIDGYVVAIVQGRNPTLWEEPGCPSEAGYIPAIECVREDWY